MQPIKLVRVFKDGSTACIGSCQDDVCFTVQATNDNKKAVRKKVGIITSKEGRCCKHHNGCLARLLSASRKWSSNSCFPKLSCETSQEEVLHGMIGLHRWTTRRFSRQMCDARYEVRGQIACFERVRLRDEVTLPHRLDTCTCMWLGARLSSFQHQLSHLASALFLDCHYACFLRSTAALFSGRAQSVWTALSDARPKPEAFFCRPNHTWKLDVGSRRKLDW